MMSDVELPEKHDVPKQKLWPIFLCAFLLAGFGFYFVYEDRVSDDESVETTVSEHVVEAISLDGDAGGTTIQMTYVSQDRAYQIVATQNVKRDERELQTSISFVLKDTTVEAREDEAFAVERRFEEVGVIVESDGKSFGKEVTNEVVRLLEAATLRLGYKEDGQLVRTEVVSSESAQLRPTLDLVGDVTRFVFPPVPTEEINVGEKWSMSFPSTVSGSEELDVEGSIAVEGTVESTGAGEALVTAKVSGSTRSTWDDGEELSGHVEVSHDGDGKLLWNLEEGRPARGSWTVKRQISEPNGASLERADITITFESADP